jgi:hypothetical protein
MSLHIQTKMTFGCNLTYMSIGWKVGISYTLMQFLYWLGVTSCILWQKNYAICLRQLEEFVVTCSIHD